ncbi:hypothetical protein LAZ67_11002327 [Cordylochernes scorpioides]|uniref:Uncharacterized protein n=1 Tax=Cordylochernes scorpioides TaxID=51811 RepID=A0ABY6KZ82_9ARAC|nr:hypothetical protein LAZ67_11002327 [Cordylochernes scorpioides]
MLLHEVRAWFIKQDAAFYQSAFVSWKEGWTKCVQRKECYNLSILSETKEYRISGIHSCRPLNDNP